MTAPETPSEKTSPLRAAVEPDAIRAALRLRRPVFRDPWDSPGDMGFSYLIISIINPLLLFLGAQALGLLGGDSRWPLGVFMAAGLSVASGSSRSSAVSARASRSTSWPSPSGSCWASWSRR